MSLAAKLDFPSSPSGLIQQESNVVRDINQTEQLIKTKVKELAQTMQYERLVQYETEELVGLQKTLNEQMKSLARIRQTKESYKLKQ